MKIFDKVISPQNYLQMVTGKCFIVKGDDDVETIENILVDEGYDSLWSHAIGEIEFIIEANLDVVLVECMVYNEETHEFDCVYRWFELPKEEY